MGVWTRMTVHHLIVDVLTSPDPCDHLVSSWTRVWVSTRPTPSRPAQKSPTFMSHLINLLISPPGTSLTYLMPQNPMKTDWLVVIVLMLLTKKKYVQLIIVWLWMKQILYKLLEKVCVLYVNNFYFYWRICDYLKRSQHTHMSLHWMIIISVSLYDLWFMQEVAELEDLYRTQT